MTIVVLGVHSIKKKESWQVLKITQAVPNPAYNKAKKVNDLMLLKVRRQFLRKRKIAGSLTQRHEDLFFVFISA